MSWQRIFTGQTRLRGVLVFAGLVTGGWAIDTLTTKVSVMPCTFKHWYVNKSGGKNGFQHGECWNKELGTVTATLTGEGTVLQQGTTVELTVISSALRTRYVIDIASRTSPQ